MPSTSATPRPCAEYRKPSLQRRACLAQIAAQSPPSPMPPSIKAISGLLLQDNAF